MPPPQKKILKLLFVLAMAFGWAYKLGTAKDSEQSIPKKSHGWMSENLFRLGLDYFRSVILFIEKRMHEFTKTINSLTICELEC